MIYMRNKNHKKHDQSQQLVKRMILDQIKQKITINQPHKVVQNKSKPSKQLYQISNSHNQAFSKNKLEQRSLCESIVVDQAKQVNHQGTDSRKINLCIENCFDIKIVNMFDQKQLLEACAKMTEQCKKQAQKCKKEIKNYELQISKCRQEVDKYREQIHEQRQEKDQMFIQNQQLKAMLLEMQKSRKEQYIYMSRKRQHKQQYSIQTEEQQFTPVNALEEGQLDKVIEQKQSRYKSGDFDQINEKQSRIKNLELEKQYISDQLIALQKDIEEHQHAYKNICQENHNLSRQLKLAQLKCERLEKELEVNQAQLVVISDQTELQKQRIKQLQSNSNQYMKNGAKSRYLELPQPNGPVTIETLLKFLKRKQLSKYHEALMQLINRYEYQLSELKSSYMDEKQMRDRFLKHSQRIYTLAISCPPPTLKQLIGNIIKFQQQIQYLKQNEIDTLLRKVKSFSIGIDPTQFENIKIELEQYVYQLQARLPTLTEQYFQDGSSVADSAHVSIEKYE